MAAFWRGVVESKPSLRFIVAGQIAARIIVVPVDFPVRQAPRVHGQPVDPCQRSKWNELHESPLVPPTPIAPWFSTLELQFREVRRPCPLALIYKSDYHVYAVDIPSRGILELQDFIE